MGISIGVTVILLLYVLAMGATFWFCVMAGTSPSLMLIGGGALTYRKVIIYSMIDMRSFVLPFLHYAYIFFAFVTINRPRHVSHGALCLPYTAR